MSSKWILPCNTDIFDVISHFSKSNQLFWGATSATQEGDILYIYVGRPYSEIKYRCHVTETNIPESIVANSNVAFLTEKKNKKNYIRLELDEVFPDGFLPYKEMTGHGLVSVQSQMRITDELAKYIIVKSNNLGKE